MIILPAVEQWANAYTFSTTINTQQSAADYQSFVMIVCAADKLSGLLFDGKASLSYVINYMLIVVIAKRRQLPLMCSLIESIHASTVRIYNLFM